MCEQWIELSQADAHFLVCPYLQDSGSDPPRPSVADSSLASALGISPLVSLQSQAVESWSGVTHKHSHPVSTESPEQKDPSATSSHNRDRLSSKPHGQWFSDLKSSISSLFGPPFPAQSASERVVPAAAEVDDSENDQVGDEGGPAPLSVHELPFAPSGQTPVPFSATPRYFQNPCPSPLPPSAEPPHPHLGIRSPASRKADVPSAAGGNVVQTGNSSLSLKSVQTEQPPASFLQPPDSHSKHAHIPPSTVSLSGSDSHSQDTAGAELADLEVPLRPVTQKLSSVGGLASLPLRPPLFLAGQQRVERGRGVGMGEGQGRERDSGEGRDVVEKRMPKRAVEKVFGCDGLRGLILDFLSMERHLHPVVVKLSRRGDLPFHMRRPDVEVIRISRRQWDNLDAFQMKIRNHIYFDDGPTPTSSAYRDNHPAFLYRGFDAGSDGYVVVQLRGGYKVYPLTLRWLLSDSSGFELTHQELSEARERRERGEAPFRTLERTLRVVATNPVAARRSRLWPSLDKEIALLLSAEPRKSILWEHTDAGLDEKPFWSREGWRWRVYKYLPYDYTFFFYPTYLGPLS
uniref:Uncharacterized protein n=1 Tax=Chromera velia CCMP2878 TaxID=1169474 RepID=A0A0G4FX04_9ALVE|eukprot:Cvel_3864.t1-p1 / transcript=Cvel_3864.t1 / gene=Cvel_3864 / organism=Chromera_velia_CCMP2878 / gene_product=hypothetical protein / transcript_product=hypothetical protein / location=Cvel_scaffold163:84952-86670(-) / protein_length=573 / sequence_SO=supercontig / SO=protein_coding / is_pseudo=false